MKNRKKCLLTGIILIAVMAIGIILNKTEKEKVVHATQLSLNLMDPSQANSIDNPYLIEGVLDLYHLQEFSKYNTCEGLFFQVSPTLKDAPPEDKLYDIDDELDDGEGIEGGGFPYHVDLLENLDPSSNSIKQTEEVWYGIGMNYCYPFKGYIDFQGITIKTDTSIFGFLGDGAEVRGLRVFGDITSEKNNEYYGNTYSPIGGIASMAYITDPNKTNASVTVTNCFVTNATITGNMSSDFGSVGGIIGLCYGHNSKHGANYDGAVNFNIETCGVQADIKCKGANGESYATALGIGSTNGVTSGVFNAEKVTNKCIGSTMRGFAGGLIGDVASLNGAYYINVNIKGDNQVFGTIESKSSSGGAVGHTVAKVNTTFTGSLSFKDNTNKLSSFVSATAKTAETFYSGLFVANPGLGIITIQKDENGNNFVFVNNDEELFDIPETGNSTAIGTPANVYRYPNFSVGAMMQGLGTDDNPYQLNTPNDFMLLSVVLSSEGQFGLSSFDTSAKDESETAFNYIRKAKYVLKDSIDISNTGINSINRRANGSFNGKLIGEIKNGVKPVLTFNRDTHQDDTGLFYIIQSAKNTQVIFQNFDITGTIKGRTRVAGISQWVLYAANYNGDIIFDNIDNTLNISCYYDAQVRNSPFISEFDAQNMFVNSATEGGIETQYTPTVSFTDLSYKGNADVYNWDFGALIGIIRLPNNRYGYRMKMDITDFDLQGDINYVSKTANNNAYVAGLIGGTSIYNGTASLVTFPSSISGTGSNYATETYYAQRSIINITNFNATNTNMTVVNEVDYQIGGYITRMMRGVDLNLNNINLTNCYTNTRYGYYGGLIYYAADMVANLNGINYSDFTINLRSPRSGTVTGGILGYTDQSGSVLFNVNDYNISNCKVIGNTKHSDFAGTTLYTHETGSEGNQEVIGAINVIGEDEYGNAYSATNPYIHKFAYQANSTSSPSEGYKSFLSMNKLMYNVFTSDKFNTTSGSSNKEDYVIHGTGTKDDPFVIDSPEKMMVMQLMSMARYRAKLDLYADYFDFVDLEYFSAKTLGEQKRDYVQKIYTGYFIFSKDIDLTDYSFTAIAATGGKYYGFNASEYLTDKGQTVTDASLKDMYLKAIDVLERDEDIIDAYEKAFETEYKAFLAEKGTGYVFLRTDKSIVATRVETNHPTIHAEYTTLKEYNEYKPEITFDAQGIGNCAKAHEGYAYLSITGNNYQRQVRGMHSGLFNNIYYCKGARKVYINNIKIKGTFSGTAVSDYYYSRGGALIADSNLSYAIYSSQVDIRNIDFGSVTMLNNAANHSTSTYGAGLMIGSLGLSDVNVYGITVLPDANVSADALIGYQTGDTSLVVLEHIDLNEAIDDFRYGLFYYNYNLGLSIYWYDDGDYEATKINTDVVTPGLIDLDGKKRVINREQIEDETYTYAFKRNKIEINPITAHIIHGNGTKDDPFVISNVAQLTSLQLAFKGLGQIAGKTEWFVGEIKNNPDFDPMDSETWELNGAHNYVIWEQTDTEAVRKQKLEHIRSAYYVITEDINLYDVPEEYKDYEIAAQGYLGLGTDTFPFSGSIDGSYKYDEATNTLSKRSENEKNSTIILNTYPGDKAYQYGLVKYGNGVNISNLHITSPKDDAGNYLPVIMANATASYGMAISYIAGGDNVIDNVTASGLVYEDGGSYNNAVGGFVGYIMSGTLTLTNIEKDAVKDFTAKYYKEETNGTITIRASSNAGGYVGRVFETSILFLDGDENYLLPTENTYTTLPADIYVNDAHYAPVRSGYGYIINKNYLKDAGKIKIKETATIGFKANLANEKQVYILSLALRCGALSVNTTYYQNIADNTYYPYGYYSRTYKINGDEDISNYNVAMLEYFNLDDVYASYDTSSKLVTLTDSGAGLLMYRLYRNDMNNMSGYSMLNQIATNTINFENGEYRTEYTLNEDGYYDMTIIPDFSGFGTRLSIDNRTSNVVYSFSSDFDGRGSTIHYVYGAPSSGNYSKSGLFNGIYERDITQSKKEYALKIKNLVITGEITAGSATNGIGYAAYAGALIGYRDTRKYLDISNVTVKDFKIINNGYYLYAGGLIGGNVYDYNYNTVSYVNNTITMTDVKIGDEVTADSPQVDGKGYSIVLDGNTNYMYSGGIYGIAYQMDIRDTDIKNIYIKGKADTGGVVGRFTIYGKYNYLENVHISDSVLSNDTGQVGGLIGTMDKTLATINRSLSAKDITLTDVDISVAAETGKEGKLVGYQYGVQESGFVDFKMEYSDDFVGHIPEKVWNNNQTTGEKKSEYFYINEFTDIEEVEKKYGIAGISEPNIENQDEDVKYTDLIATQTLVDKGDKDYLFTDADGNPLDLIPDNGRNDDFLVVEWVTDVGTMEEVLNSVLNTLTNGTGMLNQVHEDASGDTNENISVEVIAMQVSEGNVSVSSQTPSVSIKLNELTGKFEVTNNNIYDKMEKEKDGVIIPGTYSLIKISYNVSVDATNNDVGYTETICIPFMVSNMINADAYHRVTLGENYDASYLRGLNNRELTITKDSSFTVYTELMYSSNRQLFGEEEVYYVKEFVLDPKKPVIPKGTKLTMVDVTDGGSKVYYYEVKDYKTSVRLTEFVDEYGNHYEERDISDPLQLSINRIYQAMLVNNKSATKRRYGVEKYIVFVDNTNLEDVDNITGEQSVWAPGIANADGFSAEDLANKQQQTTNEIITGDVFYEVRRCVTTLNTYNGRKIGFVEDSLATQGTISEVSNLELDVSFYNKASITYWNYINNMYTQTLNDYANSEKFLEICISLVNENGEKILLPAGTKVKYGNNLDFEGIKSTSHIYYYKDAGTSGFRLMDISEDTITDMHLEFDFSNARMENLPAGNYRLELELLRTGNKDFPMGSEVLDLVRTDLIAVTDAVEYGFSISGYDKEKLAYNKKHDTGSFVLDYNLSLNSSFDLKLTAEKSVKITYELLEKDPETGLYEPYTPVDGIYPQLTIGDLSSTGYEVVDNGNTICNGTAGIIDITDTDSVFTSLSQIITVQDVPGVGEEVLQIPFKLTMPDNAKAVNYKIVAKLYAGEEDVKEAEDMVIFNISDISLD